MPEFDYDKTAVENRIGTVIDQLGPKLIDHATNKPIISVLEKKDPNEKRDFIMIPYHVRLPYGEIGFTIHKSMYNAMIFGNKCKLVHVPNFIETLILSGQAHLREAAENRGNVADNIKKAAQYRIIKEAVLASAMMSPRLAIKKTRQAYPMAITMDSIQTLVIDADTALKNITRKPRQLGFAIGIVCMAAFYAAYFLGPYRQMGIGFADTFALRAGLDASTAITGFYLGLFSIQIAGWKALRNALKGLVPAGQEKKFTPKAGKSGEYILFLMPILFLAFTECARQMGQSVPEWYSALLTIIFNG
jgi:hypothetical protein